MGRKTIKDKLLDIMKRNNGFITTKEAAKNGISREHLSKLTQKGIIERARIGVYKLCDIDNDACYIYQIKHPPTIVSHLTAMYYHGFLDEEPKNIDFTVYSKYTDDRRDEKIKLHYVSYDIHDFGLTKIKTNLGNEVVAYNVERSVCDIIKSNTKIDERLFYVALKNYFDSEICDLKKLREYAKKLGYTKKVEKYIKIYCGEKV